MHPDASKTSLPQTSLCKETSFHRPLQGNLLPQAHHFLPLTTVWPSTDNPFQGNIPPEVTPTTLQKLQASTSDPKSDLYLAASVDSKPPLPLEAFQRQWWFEIDKRNLRSPRTTHQEMAVEPVTVLQPLVPKLPKSLEPVKLHSQVVSIICKRIRQHQSGWGGTLDLIRRQP